MKNRGLFILIIIVAIIHAVLFWTLQEGAKLKPDPEENVRRLPTDQDLEQIETGILIDLEAFIINGDTLANENI